MPTVDLTVTVTTPTGTTTAEALRLYTDQNGYNASLGLTRAQYARQLIAHEVAQDIRTRRRYEAAATAEAAVPDDITVA
jgi:hypothetical protein